MTTSTALKNNKKIILIIVSLYLFYFLGFIFDEDSNGGAIRDYKSYLKFIDHFILDFKTSFLNFNEIGERHSPMLIMILSLFYKLNINDTVIRFVNFNLSIISIIFFYKCLVIKFKEVDNNYLILISAIFFLSPTFRSLSIWPDSRIYGLHFFVISVYFFLKFIYFDKKVIFCYLNILFLAIASYFSPNFSLFSIFFLYKFYNHLKFSKELLICVILNLVLAFPAFYYLFVLKVFFLTSNKNMPGSFVNEFGFYTDFNLSNKILIISSLIMFYFLPFILIKKKLFFYKNSISLKEIIFLTIFFLINVNFFNYQMGFTGGGIFLHLSNLVFNNNLLFYFISFYSIFVIYEICKNNKDNFFIIALIVSSNPQLSIYHKYYDPLIFFLFFSLFNIDLKKSFFNKKNITLIYIFYFFFLFLNLIKSGF